MESKTSLMTTAQTDKTLTSDFPTTIETILAELERTGFVCIENAVTKEWLERAQSEVKALLNSNGNKYFSITRPADRKGSAAEDLVHNAKLSALLRNITQAVCPSGLADYEEVYNVLRIIAGPKGSAGSLGFHYDASVLTALVPVFIPEAGRGKSGELLVFPNRRPFRKSVVFNVVEKFFLQNRIASYFATQKVNDDLESFARDLVPGNMYLFYGYRTYHANLACLPNSLRATMLLHYGNPHGESGALKMVRNGRRSFEALRRRFG